MIRWQDFARYPVFGVDEVGRGCLAGPVVSAAVTIKRDENASSAFFILSEEQLPTLDPHMTLYQDFFKKWLVRISEIPETCDIKELTDSKKLTEKKRISLIGTISKYFQFSVGLASPQEIDSLNILQASLLSMHRAVKGLENLICQKANHLLIDGIFKLPNWSGPQTPIIQGDLKCDLISAASIVAKVFRDQLMDEFDQIYPEYGFSDHKGYPSPLHKQKILEMGPSDIHRLSFKGVKPLNNQKFEPRL